ncbi:MAG: hypothetical protein GX957_14035 [Clostridiaceae bacterium]|nr:hypothetical protein [Clostridiaceae bacterium]
MGKTDLSPRVIHDFEGVISGVTITNQAVYCSIEYVWEEFECRGVILSKEIVQEMVDSIDYLTRKSEFHFEQHTFENMFSDLFFAIDHGNKEDAYLIPDFGEERFYENLCVLIDNLVHSEMI